jgi:hypothetical protein
VLENKHTLSACSGPLHKTLVTAADLHAARAVPGVHVLDNTSAFCTPTRCRQVVGSVLAYRDDNHLTLEMVSALRPRLEAAIDALL